MVVPITFLEGGRNKLAIVCCCLCAILSLAGLCVIGIGVFIKYRINDELILLESYNSDVLPLFLVSVGTLMTLINGVSIKLIYDSGFASTSEKFRMVLLPLAILMFLFMWVVLAAGILTLVHRSDVEEALHDGLKDAMSRYKINLSVKVTLDRIQIRSRCCGSISYKDWFNTGWINTDYVNKTDPAVASKMIKGELYIESVPYSCCDVRVRRPCVTHDVLDKTKHKNYDSVTLYKQGCTGALMDEYENVILHPTGTTVMTLFGIQFVVFILLRYLQTSIQSAYDEGDPAGPGRGSVIPTQMCDSLATGNPEKYQQEALSRIRGETTGGDDDNEFDDDSPTAPLTGGAGTSPGYMPDMEAVNDPRWGDDGAGMDYGGMDETDIDSGMSRKDKKSQKENKPQKDQPETPKEKQKQLKQQQKQQQKQQKEEMKKKQKEQKQIQKQQKDREKREKKEQKQKEQAAKKSPKKEKSPKSTKTPKQSKRSRSPSRTKSTSPKSPKPTKAPKPSKKSRSPSRSRSTSPKSPKPRKTPKPSKKSRSPSRSKSTSPKSSKKARSPSRSKSPKRSSKRR